MSILQPQSSIVPILKGDTDRAIRELLGTGFFVGTPQEPYLVTAKHVFENTSLSGGEHFAYTFMGDSSLELRPLYKITYSDTYDVAICRLNPDERYVPLNLASDDPALNDDVFTYEYSSTRFEAKADGGLHISFEPLSHKGNVMRFYDSTFPESKPTPSLQVFYPALQGASGAPVIATTTNKQFAVCGILVANIERELLPAQILRIEGPDESIEETKYFLPHGKALHVKVIAQFLSKIGVENINTVSTGSNDA